MEEILVRGHNLPIAYHNALQCLRMHGMRYPAPDWNDERLECSMTIVVENPLEEPMISKLGCVTPEHLQQYIMEICDGLLDFEVGRTLAYTYHDRMVEWLGDHRLVDQIEFVTNELKRNPYSTRAVIDVRNNGVDVYENDIPCLQHMQFFIRNSFFEWPEHSLNPSLDGTKTNDDKLNLKVVMRSNDAFNGTFMNMFGFVMLQKKIADALGIEVGTYTHRANSFHVYGRMLEKFDGMVDRLIYTNDAYSLCYSYEDEWKALMDAAVPDILKKIEQQKAKYE